jgi:hypothetical protein
MVRIVFQRSAYLPDGIVQPLFEINEGFCSPDFPRQLLTCDNLSSVVYKQDQYSRRLLLEFYEISVAAQLCVGEVQLKVAKTNITQSSRWCTQTARSSKAGKQVGE